VFKPGQAIFTTGRRKDWVARQMSISPSYLSRLLSAERPWTERTRRSFAQALGFSSEAIDFAADAPETPATPPSPPPAGHESTRWPSDTRDPSSDALAPSQPPDLLTSLRNR